MNDINTITLLAITIARLIRVHKIHNRNRRSIQMYAPKRPHKPSSQNLGPRRLGIDRINREFHLGKMKEYEGTNIPGPNGRSMWWYHREMYWKITNTTPSNYMNHRFVREL